MMRLNFQAAFLAFGSEAAFLRPELPDSESLTYTQKLSRPEFLETPYVHITSHDVSLAQDRDDQNDDSPHENVTRQISRAETFYSVCLSEKAEELPSFTVTIESGDECPLDNVAGSAETQQCAAMLDALSAGGDFLDDENDCDEEDGSLIVDRGSLVDSEQRVSLRKKETTWSQKFSGVAARLCCPCMPETMLPSNMSVVEKGKVKVTCAAGVKQGVKSARKAAKKAKPQLLSKKLSGLILNNTGEQPVFKSTEVKSNLTAQNLEQHTAASYTSYELVVGPPTNASGLVRAAPSRAASVSSVGQSELSRFHSCHSEDEGFCSQSSQLPLLVAPTRGLLPHEQQVVAWSSSIAQSISVDPSVATFKARLHNIGLREFVESFLLKESPVPLWNFQQFGEVGVKFTQEVAVDENTLNMTSEDFSGHYKMHQDGITHTLFSASDKVQFSFIETLTGKGLQWEKQMPIRVKFFGIDLNIQLTVRPMQPEEGEKSTLILLNLCLFAQNTCRFALEVFS